jgi:hypothetical protein
MTANLASLEAFLGIALSKTFHEFWKAHVPDKTLPFEVQKRRLGGPFGRRGPHPTKPGWWLIEIEIESNLPSLHLEVTLAHEIVHLVLDKEGYPVVWSPKPPKGQMWGPIAMYLHSVLVHPVVWLRLREWGFPVDDHIRVKATGRLKDLQSMDLRRKAPKRKQFLDWQLWLLQYILARLQWGEPERTQIYEMFADHSITVIGRYGERYLKRLDSLCYFDPQNLSPQIVKQAGQELLNKLDLSEYFSLKTLEELGQIQPPENYPL